MKTKKILVIEDDPLNMKLTKSVLTISKYEVVEADDAEKGIELAHDCRPDLILMDIALPGMSGLEATRAFKADPMTAKIPIVALTSFAMEGDEKKAFDAGCIGYVTKPIKTREFVNNIADFLKHKENTESDNKIDNNEKILIVDDEPLNRKLLSARLSHANYTIFTASDGRDAIEKVYEKSPDLILLDIMMPVMDGYEVTRKLKADDKTKQIPIILITAMEEADFKTIGLEAGADEFLNKPVNTNELLSRVRSLLSLKEYNDRIMNLSKDDFSESTEKEKKSQKQKHLQSVFIAVDDQKEKKIIEMYLHGQPLQLEFPTSIENLLTSAEKDQADLVLIDTDLIGAGNFDINERLKYIHVDKNIPILAICSLREFDTNTSDIECWADDFLIRPINIHELRARVGALLKKKSLFDRFCARMNDNIESAVIDKTTGLYNRGYFEHFLNLEIKKTLRYGNPFSLVIFKIDDQTGQFRNLSHLSRKTFLREMGRIIKNNVREVDVGVHYCERKFALVLPNTEINGAEIVVVRIKKMIQEHDFIEDCKPLIKNIKIGISGCPDGGDTADKLFDTAEEMLHP